jgi:hypothetical protein
MGIGTPSASSTGGDPFTALGAERPTVTRVKEQRMATQNVDSLNLTSKAKSGAQSILEQFPKIMFTSGRRDLPGQAQAMAGNVVKVRDYIAKTYASSDASKACQKWVDDHAEATKQADIGAGLLETLKALGAKAGQISKHLTGEAFDVQPTGTDADAIKKAMKGLPGVTKFLEKEARLTIWHAEF